MKTNNKIQRIFNIVSLLFLVSIIIFYSYRFIYYKFKNKNHNHTKILSQYIINQYNNFELVNDVDKIDKEYYFVGKSKKNYIRYKGLLWRIIKINSDKSITIILEDSINNMTYNNVMKWLNSGNENYTGIFYNSLYNKKMDYNEENNYINNKNNYLCDKLNKDRIYLLSLNDYNNTGKEDSYLNNKTDFWISEENMYISSEGTIESDNDNNYYNIRPVIILDNNIKINKGDGSIDNPYNIKNKKIDTLKDIEPYSYIDYNNTLWMVLEVNDNIKLISDSCIKDENNTCITKYFSQYNNKINKYKQNSLLYYLNYNYYNKLDNKEYLTKGIFYIGNYKDNNYLSIYKDSIELKIGLPTIADSYAYKLDNTFLLTTSENNDLNIFISLDNHPYETLITEKANIRPIIYMKDNISIVDGDGTYSSPYKLGGLINEEE